MDCRSFQNQHFAYLDDTLPGDVMAAAQRHIMDCDSCAAHDTLVRRSLMMVKSLPSIEPSDAFRERLRSRLAECRELESAGIVVTDSPWRINMRPSYALMVAATTVVVAGAFAWQAASTPVTTTIALEPVRVMRPVAPSDDAMPYLSPALMQAMATGNPVWPAAMLLEDAPSQYLNNNEGLTTVRGTR